MPIVHFARQSHLTGQKPREFVGTAAQALVYVYSANLHRRHLNTGQRAFIAVDIKRELQETVTQGQRTDLTCGNISTSDEERNPAARDIAGKIVHVSRASVYKAEKLLEEAPDLAERVRAGEMPLSA